MVTRIIDAALDNTFRVLVLVLVLVGVGWISLRTIPLGAVPDIANGQVQVLTDAPSLSPVEVEKFVTFPVEAAMSGIPKVKEIRSVTPFGLSAVTVIFEDGTDIYWARQLWPVSRLRHNVPKSGDRDTTVGFNIRSRIREVGVSRWVSVCCSGFRLRFAVDCRLWTLP